MSIYETVRRIKGGIESNQSQVWTAGQLGETVAWIDAAAKLLRDVADGKEHDRGDRSLALELVRQADGMI